MNSPAKNKDEIPAFAGMTAEDIEKLAPARDNKH